MATRTFAQRGAYLELARSVGVRWRGYSVIAAVPCAAIAVGVATPPFPLKQPCVGVAVGMATMLLALSLTAFDSRMMRGHMAETFSIENLRKMRRWTVIENLPFETVDVDHVVIAPSGVLAIESKFFGPTGSLAYECDRARTARQCAKRSARLVSLLLRSRNLHEQISVTPVLMVWGPGRPKFAEPFRVVDGVYVVQAEYPKLWAHLFDAARVDDVVRASVYAAFEDHRSRRAAHDAREVPTLRTGLWQEFRGGMRSEREGRALRASQEAELRDRHRVGRRAA